MEILKQLPATAKEYFDFYHKRAVTELVGHGDLEKILQELRRAYKTYPKHKPRIANIAATLKQGIKTPIPKRLNNSTFTKNVKDSML